ncbi:hypothetical protein BEWA_006020 [Theileria equi strain WA]|uniref:Uncharacterized protein n=1 Tax=Theileria equi strain WA TaxID=1537102 RepID=L0B0Z9_THEEQ|nr:hypothetical protein BEWA_006020 [Theileria equi strain WA]AFZ81193.1 hypothetical protein BEWA_006020 [Theileria equi strain WA]|eukprot:XP_004830859.1 hypothetical protein BEWA_006020 [Theileria equi strain WA]
MEIKVSGPVDSLTSADLEIFDDITSSFSESVEDVLNKNFSQQKKTEVASENPNPEENTTKNKKLAAIYCRQWLSGVLSILSHKLAQEPATPLKNATMPIPSEPEFVEDNLDFQGVEDMGIFVDNAKVCGDGQIEVDYDSVKPTDNSQFKPKLKAKELMQIILQGKEAEWLLHKKLEGFWKSSPGLLMQLINSELEPINDDEAAPDNMEEVTSIDEKSLSFLNELLENDREELNKNMEEYMANDPKLLIDYASSLGIVGMDRLVELFNKVKKEITHVNKMARFFSKFAIELNSPRNQVEIM